MHLKFNHFSPHFFFFLLLPQTPPLYMAERKKMSNHSEYSSLILIFSFDFLQKKKKYNNKQRFFWGNCFKSFHLSFPGFFIYFIFFYISLFFFLYRDRKQLFLWILPLTNKYKIFDLFKRKKIKNTWHLEVGLSIRRLKL